MADPLPPLAPTPAFLAEADSFGIAFDDGDLDRLGRYLALLLDANSRFNLTAITDPAEAWMKHVFDSLTLMPLLEAAEAKDVIDVGSGGGLPGIPLAIAMPGVRFTLLEATGKKAAFLREAVEALALPNVEVISERAETIGRDRDRHREQYDAVLARAVGKLRVLLELTLPLARVGGLVITIKGASAGQEVEDAAGALHALHGQVVHTTRTPTGTILVVEKLRPTGKLYPRLPGEPKRAPL
jgi:16S rRNA (guanine527-N7)-methyltransferase